jgi:hypothetical protein
MDALRIVHTKTPSTTAKEKGAVFNIENSPF